MSRLDSAKVKQQTSVHSERFMRYEALQLTVSHVYTGGFLAYKGNSQ